MYNGILDNTEKIWILQVTEDMESLIFAVNINKGQIIIIKRYNDGVLITHTAQL